MEMGGVFESDGLADADLLVAESGLPNVTENRH